MQKDLQNPVPADNAQARNELTDRCGCGCGMTRLEFNAHGAEYRLSYPFKTTPVARYALTDAGRAALEDYDTDEDYAFGPPMAHGCAVAILVCTVVSALGWWGIIALWHLVTR